MQVYRVYKQNATGLNATGENATKTKCPRTKCHGKKGYTTTKCNKRL